MQTRLEKIIESVFGAIFIGVCILFSPLLRLWYNRWGATSEETARPLPGDERTPNPRLSYTRAITIHAPPPLVWPWIAQIGQGRGGLYSYDMLENLIGCQIHSLDEIIPELQSPRPGDLIRLGPPGYPLYKVMAVEPERSFILTAADVKTEQAFEPTTPLPESYVNFNWVFFLEAPNPHTTRLIVRMRMDYQPRSFTNWLIWRFFSEPVNFVMERKMLLGIQKRADSLSQTRRRAWTNEY